MTDITQDLESAIRAASDAARYARSAADAARLVGATSDVRRAELAVDTVEQTIEYAVHAAGDVRATAQAEFLALSAARDAMRAARDAECAAGNAECTAVIHAMGDAEFVAVRNARGTVRTARDAECIARNVVRATRDAADVAARAGCDIWNTIFVVTRNL